MRVIGYNKNTQHQWDMPTFDYDFFFGTHVGF